MSGRQGGAGKVGVVLAGAGARGAYEAGAMSVLLPLLDERDERPTIFVGTSAGAINALLLASLAHLPAEQAAAALVDRWWRTQRRDVIGRLLMTAPRLAMRYGAEFMGMSRLPLTSVLDTSPLRRTAEDSTWIDWNQLHENVRSGAVEAVGVVATRRGDGRTVVFVETRPGVELPPADDERGIRYVAARLGPQHLLASAAIPVAFQPVWVDEPPETSGWYLDGGVRLNVPIKPALLLGAHRVVIVATDPPRRPTESAVTATRSKRMPRVTDAAAHTLHAVFIDPMIEDVRGLVRINKMVLEAGGPLPEPSGSRGRSYRAVRFMFVGPVEEGGIVDTADTVFRRKYAGLRGLLPSDFPLLSRLLGAGGYSHGELMSYLFFDRDFLREVVALGQNDARAMLERHPNPWRLEHMPGRHMVGVPPSPEPSSEPKPGAKPAVAATQPRPAAARRRRKTPARRAATTTNGRPKTPA